MDSSQKKVDVQNQQCHRTNRTEHPKACVDFQRFIREERMLKAKRDDGGSCRHQLRDAGGAFRLYKQRAGCWAVNAVEKDTKRRRLKLADVR